MLKDDLARAIAQEARARGYDAVGTLGLVEVETAGKPFEADGSTPAFLFERHVFHRELKARAPRKLAEAVRAGLAIPKWSKATQYKDQGTSAGRRQVITRARAIDEECANRSASWGLGQIMGNHAAEIGYASATDMVDELVAGGITAQLDCFFRLLDKMALKEPLRLRQAQTCARKYNGAGYAANQYDARLAAAWRRWERQIAQVAPEGTKGRAVAPPEQALTRDQVTALQSKLVALGYAEAGQVDGAWGTKTIAALAAFQAHEGLRVSGHYDAETATALKAAEPRPASIEREEATAQDLRQAGSVTVAKADTLSLWGKVLAFLGLGGGAGKTAESVGLLNVAQEKAEQLSGFKGLFDNLAELWGFVIEHAGLVVCLVLVAAGVAIVVQARALIKRRLEDHRSGKAAFVGSAQ